MIIICPYCNEEVGATTEAQNKGWYCPYCSKFVKGDEQGKDGART